MGIPEDFGNAFSTSWRGKEERIVSEWRHERKCVVLFLGEWYNFRVIYLIRSKIDKRSKENNFRWKNKALK